MEPWDLIMVWSKALYLLQGPNCPLRWVMYQTPEPLMTSTIEKCHDSNAGPQLTSTIIKKTLYVQRRTSNDLLDVKFLIFELLFHFQL